MNQVRGLQNQYFHSKTGDGTLPQAILDETRPKVGGVHDYFLSDLFFVTVGFRFTVDCRSPVTDGECTQIHLTRHFFSCTLRACTSVHTHHLAQDEPRLKCLHARVSPILLSSMMRRFEHLFLVVSSFWLSPCISPSPCLFSFPLLPVLCPETSSSMWTTPRQNITCASANRGVLLPGRIHSSPHVMSPKLLDDVHFSETTENDLPGGIRRRRHGALVLVWRGTSTMRLWEKALSSPLFIPEREETSGTEGQAYHSYEESLLPAQSFFTHLKNGETRARTLFAKFVQQRKNQVAKWKNQQIRILLERQREQIFAGCGAEIQKHEVPNRLRQKKCPKIEWSYPPLSEVKLIVLFKDMKQLQRDQLLLHEQLSEQNRDLREAHMKSLNEMEELKAISRGRHSMNFWGGEDWSKIKTLSMNSRPEFRKLHNEVSCLNDSRDF